MNLERTCHASYRLIEYPLVSNVSFLFTLVACATEMRDRGLALPVVEALKVEDTPLTVVLKY
jgi:hypothetical protein